VPFPEDSVKEGAAAYSCQMASLKFADSLAM
jgi:hypothetical protein